MADNFLSRLLGNFRASEYVNQTQTKSTIDSASNPMIMGWQTPSGYISNIDQMDDGFTNSAVTACLNVLSTSFIEPELQVCRYVDGEHEYLYDHELKKLYYEPNPYMSGDLLAKYIVTAIATQGDAYLLKNRTDGGRVVELYPLISQYVTPKGNKENLITHYEYAPQYMNAVNFERDDIVHIRHQINPLNHKVGYAPLQSVLREIIGDESAGQFAVALLQNMGIPSVIMMPKGDIPLSAEEAQQISETYQRRFGGQNRGKPLILTGGEMDIKPVSFSPSDLDIGKLRQIPEERISAVLGVPAILAGLGAGLERATYSNARELREYFTETRMVPLWKTVAQAITNQLLKVDYGEEDTFVKYDTSTVRAFQTDEKELYDRLNVGVQGGWITVAEAREKVGLPINESQEIYLISANQVPTPANLEVPEVETVAQSTDPKTPEVETEDDMEQSSYGSKVIRKIEDQFCVIAEDSGRNMGCYATRELAERRLQQISRYSDDPKAKVGTDEFTTLEEAEKRAEELGCNGTHTHENDGTTIYMPCATHQEYEQRFTTEDE